VISRRTLLAASAATTLTSRLGRAQSPAIKIGVLNDQSGPYRDTGGQTSVACVRQAVQDFGDHGITAEVVFADHQNKPDLGVSIARQWFDRDGVDVIVDVPTSSVALAVSGVVREKNKVYLNSGAGTSDLTGVQCSPNTVHWTYDTYMLSKSTGGAMAKAGGDSWYFVTADYVFGQQLQRDTSRFVTEAGGKVLGASTYPFPGTSDFSSFLLAAQASGAKVLMFISDVNGLGLEVAQGLNLTESFYWDLNDRTRAFTNRVKSKTPDNWPGMDPAGCYAATLHYLKAAADMGAAKAKADGSTAVARMKAMPTDDDAFGHGSIRQDGRGMFPAYLFQVKTPAESRGKWDYYKLVATTPAEQAFRPLAEGGCPLVHA